MSDSPWFPFYAGDFTSSTSHYAPAVIGVYVRLLAHQWLVGALPIDDDHALCRVAGVFPDELETYREMIEDKFPEGLNPRLEKERSKRETRRRNGSQGGRPKSKAKAKSKPNEKLTANRNETDQVTEEVTKTKGSQSQSQSHNLSLFSREGAPLSTADEQNRVEEFFKVAGLSGCFANIRPERLSDYAQNMNFLMDPDHWQKVKANVKPWLESIDWNGSPVTINNIAPHLQAIVDFKTPNTGDKYNNGF